MKLHPLHCALFPIALAASVLLASAPAAAATDPVASGQFEIARPLLGGTTDRIEATTVARADRIVGDCSVAPGGDCAYANDAPVAAGQTVSESAETGLDRAEANDLQPKFRRARSR
jgi:hypothetical protein